MRNLIVVFLFTPCFSFFTKAQIFSDQTANAEIDHLFDVGDYHFGGGVVPFDFNNDGWEDLFITGGANGDQLYKNNGDGTFEDVTLVAGLTHVNSILTQGAVAGDLNNDGHKDLVITTRCLISDLNQYTHNLLYKNNGDGTFSDVSAQASFVGDSLFSTSATLTDIDCDGLLDIYIGNYLREDFYDIFDDTSNYSNDPNRYNGERNLFFHNLGDFQFEEVAESWGIADTGLALAVAFIDFDNDDDLDLYVANDFGWRVPNALYRNDYPDAGFIDIRASSGTNAAINAMGIASGDYDDDGLMDIYVTDMFDNILYQQYSPASFEDVAHLTGVDDALRFNNEGMFDCFEYQADDGFVGIDEFSMQVCDSFNNCLTVRALLYVGIEFPPAVDSLGTDLSDTLYFQLHEGGITRNCAMITDTTGRPYQLAALSQPANGSLQMINGATHAGISWGANFFDYDHDKDLDLFVCNGVLTPFEGDETLNPSSLYSNDGDGVFTDVSLTSGVDNPYMGRGSAVFDYDNDGDLDLFQVNLDYPDSSALQGQTRSALYRNDLSSNAAWLKVKLVGTTSNRDGIGAQVAVVSNGKRMLREIDGGSSFLSQNSTIAHFGLADATTVDSIIVRWPCGERQRFADQAVNQQITIAQPSPTGIASDQSFSEIELLPNPAKDRFQLGLIAQGAASASLTIYDSRGSSIFTTEVKIVAGENRFDFDMKSCNILSSGSYHVELNSASLKQTLPLIVID